MLFDLQSGKRRRVVQVVFGTMALLFGVSFLFFGIGSEASGGLADLFGFGTNSQSTGNPQFDEQVEDAEDAVAADPKDEKALLELAQVRYQAGQFQLEADPETGQPVVTEGCEGELRGRARRLGAVHRPRAEEARPEHGRPGRPGLRPARGRPGRRRGAADRRRGQPLGRHLRQPRLLPLRVRRHRGRRRGGGARGRELRPRPGRPDRKAARPALRAGREAQEGGREGRRAGRPGGQPGGRPDRGPVRQPGRHRRPRRHRSDGPAGSLAAGSTGATITRPRAVSSIGRAGAS